MVLKLLLASTFALAGAATTQAANVQATVNSINANGVGAAIGTVTFQDTKWGLLVTPDLSGLPSRFPHS